MNFEQANAIALTAILQTLGFKPVEEDADKALYFSPFGEGEIATFEISKTENRWAENITGASGDTLEIDSRHLKQSGEDHTREDARRWLSNMMSGNENLVPDTITEKSKKQPKPQWRLIRQEPLDNLALVRYLINRGINADLAAKHLVEVYISNTATNRKYYALGFKNEDGGYQVRNTFLKTHIGPRMITVIPGQKSYPPNVHIFKDFIDYTSFLTLRDGSHEGQAIVLNSRAGIKQAIPFIRKYGYRTVQSWLDNNEAGTMATDLLKGFIKTQENLRHSPMNRVYKGCNSLNKWRIKNPELKVEEQI